MFSYCAVFVLLCSSFALEQPSVITKLGTVNGFHKTSYNGRTYSAFEGIPYAKPPVGNLRFEAPVEPNPWEDVLDANTKYACPQIDVISHNVTGSEDCLYLNVYVPQDIPNVNDSMSVIVHFHGGAFMFGGSNKAGPLFFMDRDVIFVSLNYRLGALGFLSTEDNVVPGNNGLKDQSMALQWIQNNIKQFGGNPDSVTITGTSAGAGSVHFHYFSQMSKGLFHRGVSQSGTALAPWALQEGALETTNALAVLAGCTDTTTTRTVIDCLKTKSSDDIIKQTVNMMSFAGDTLFAPVVEVKTNFTFLEDYPYQLLTRGEFNDLPWMTSMCTEDGSIALFYLYRELDILNEKFNKFAYYYLDYNYTTCDANKADVAQKIRRQYFGTERIGKDSYRNLIQLFGDRMFGFSLEKSARMQANASRSKIYSYIYGYKNSFSDSFVKMMGINDIELGVGHAEDKQLLYDVKLLWAESLRYVLSKTDELIKDLMVDMYVSFADSNAPKINGLDLDAVSNSEDFNYLSIKSPTNIKMAITEELTPTKFWEELPIIENEPFPINSCNKDLIQ